MKTLNLIRNLDDYNFFIATKPGILFSIILASIPEAIATVFLFASLFAERGGSLMNYGIAIGATVSFVIYFLWAYGMAVQGNAFMSFLGTFVGGSIAYLGWYLTFLGVDTSGMSPLELQIHEFKFYTAIVFVAGNALLLAVLNHKMYIKTSDNVAFIKGEEKILDKALSSVRKSSLRDHIADMLSEESLSEILPGYNKPAKQKKPKSPAIVLEGGNEDKKMQEILNSLNL